MSDHSTRNFTSILLIIILLFSAVLLPATTVLAQQESGQALEISPPSLTLQVDPGQTQNFELLIRNVSNSEIVASGAINDFVAAGEDGVPRILLDEDDNQDNPFSFKNWVEPLPEILLAPGELKSIPITINVPNDASPGGHYGVVRYSGSGTDLDQTGVSLAASLGTLVLVEVSGETTKQIEIEEFSVQKDGTAGTLFESTPVTLVERLKNTGNVHTQPTGTVAITNMFGQAVATANVNLPDRFVLPNSIRRFEQPIDSSLIGDRWLFGRYTASLDLTYDGDKKLTQQINFWIIPYKLVAAIVVGLIVLFFIGRFALRRYNERVVRRSRRF